MELTNILPQNRISTFNKRGIFSVEDLQNFLPRKYHDFSRLGYLCPEANGVEILVTAEVIDFKKSQTGRKYFKAKCKEDRSGFYFNVFWFGYVNERYIRNIKKAVIAGKVKKDDYGYSITNPTMFLDVTNKNKVMKIMPVYKKLTGISEEALAEAIVRSLAYNVETFGREDLKAKYGLYTHQKAIKTLHTPESMNDVFIAKKSLIYERMYTFLTQIRNLRSYTKSTITNINDTLKDRYEQTLPFALTVSQSKAIESMIEKAKTGNRISALLQGDVGSGKTAVAFALISAFSNYQSVLMAPTVILAKQHYDAFKPIADSLGIKIVFVSTALKQSEKNKVFEAVKNGDYDCIIGTHSCLNLEYKNLGLVIVDEEHRFGVAQRDKLNNCNVHKLSMSATPIPRTLAGAVYENLVDIYDLELPSERKRVKTYYMNDMDTILKNVKGIRERGDQVYVVCPAIEENDDILSVEEVCDIYRKALPGLRIECVTGKSTDSDKTINEFASGNIDVLIATTVIEVGVNVPNANLIIIHNAERFGLSQLHQLRGRVGRGSRQGFCILESKEKTERINIMLETTDGFEIAERDMRLRGSGNLFGTEQSGKNEDLDLIMEYPNIFKHVKADMEAE